MMLQALLRALLSVVPSNACGDARYVRYATQLTQRLQDRAENPRVINASRAVDNRVSGRFEVVIS
jgi:hypothetical protein